jgi:hypothetical protein
MAFALHLMQETHESLLNVQYGWKIIVVKVLIDAFTSSLLESMALALIS